MFHVPEKYRYRATSNASFGNNGQFMIGKLRVIASDGEDWEHVSVSLSNRTPRWAEMCKIKGIFWDEEDCVIQYHPPESEYVNCHPFVLHLWRPTEIVIPQPPSIFV